MRRLFFPQRRASSARARAAPSAETAPAPRSPSPADFTSASPKPAEKAAINGDVPTASNSDNLYATTNNAEAAAPAAAEKASFQNDATRDSPELRRRPSLARRLSRTLFGSTKSADDLPATMVSTFHRNDMDGLEDALSVVVFENHALAVTKDGRIIAVGDNSLGQLDASRKPDAFMSGLKSISELDSVACVSTSSCYSAATTRDGLVFSWGTNTFSTLGHSKTSTAAAPVAARLLDGPIRREKCVQVACEQLALYVLTDRGTVWACSRATNGIAAPLRGVLSGCMIASIFAGPNHAIFLSFTGLVFALGSNESGALGLDPIRFWNVAQPVIVELAEPIMFAACGSEHSVFVTTQGTLLTCGSGRDGNLGREVDACARAHWKPSPVSSECTKPARLVACGDTHTLVASSDGSLFAFGGQFQENPFASMAIGPGRRVVKVAAGASASAIIVVDISANLTSLPRLGPRMNRLDAKTLHALATEAEAKSSLGALMGALGEMHMACLNRSFLQSGMEIDPVAVGIFGAESEWNAKSHLGIDIVNFEWAMRAVWRAFEKADAAWLLVKTDELLAELLDWAPHVSIKEHLRAYLLCMLNPFISLLPMTSLTRLVKAWAALPASRLRELCEYAVSDLSIEELKESVIKRLLSVVDSAAAAQDWTDRAGISQAITVLSQLHEIVGDRLALGDFYAKQPSQWDIETLISEFGRFVHFERLREAGQTTQGNFVSLFSAPFLLSAETKRDVMQAEAQYRQLSAVIVELSHHQQEPTDEQTMFLEFTVRRDALVHDVLENVALAKKQGRLLKPLKVIFSGEEGLDFGGVRKEFFELLSAQLFRDCFKVADAQAGVLWFDLEFADVARLELVGTLIGLAIYNSTLLDVHFPAALYSSLLGSPVSNPSLEDLASVDPALSHGLKAMLDLPQEEFNESFEGLTFEGLKAEGQDQTVDFESREEYVRLRARNFMFDSVESKLLALVRGFSSVCGEARAMRLFRPLELERALIGDPSVDLVALRNNTSYEGGYSESSVVIQWFWDVLENVLDSRQRASLLGFSTGSSRTPIGGTLAIKIQRAGPDSDQLPTSHTCFNTLLLPEYSHKEKLQEKLILALENSKGFGLR